MLGEMQHRITLQNPQRVDNGRGGWTLNYSNGLQQQVWAAADLLSVSNQLRYQEWDKAASMAFIIRDNPFLQRDTRILFNGDTYELLQYGPAKRKGFLELRAREV